MDDEMEAGEATASARDVQAFHVAVAVLVSALADIVDRLAPGELAKLRFSGAPEDPDATDRINRHLDSLLRRPSADSVARVE